MPHFIEEESKAQREGTTSSPLSLPQATTFSGFTSKLQIESLGAGTLEAGPGLADGLPAPRAGWAEVN